MNIERLVCVGVNHQSAPLDLREQLSQWPAGELRNEFIDELVILSTCNRLELYAYLSSVVAITPNSANRFQPLLNLIVATQGISAAELDAHLYCYSGEAVANHLSRVATGLDSVVMGEGQILGQVSRALQQAYATKSVGQVLTLLFRTAINAGKRARTETKISANPVSISSAAVALASHEMDDLHTKSVAVVGLGEMGQLALKGLRGKGVTDLLLLNRTRARADSLVDIYGGEAIDLDQLPNTLCRADVVITATSSVAPIVDQDMVFRALAKRAGRPLILIDLAVPRNIDPLIATAQADVTLFDVDDMRSVVDDAFSARQAEIPFVNNIIDELLADWRTSMQALQLRPVVVGLRQQAEQIREQTLNRTMRYLERQQGDVDEATAAQLAFLSRALVNQLLHTPTVKLKEKSRQADGAAYAALICELFGLDVSLPEDETAPSFELNWLLPDSQLDSVEDDVSDAQIGDADFFAAFTPTKYSSPDQKIHESTNLYDQYELVGQP